eukprot:CAMPEP_0172910408 /NCGR_PEP_ID=MMETSP1075-20121228/184579_1 /TAXON_ID=2916 /ORGANISM="Ceratium fusus, Strain PA161109" /LENGTH=100 /DNA_ID=CAMNT_0013768539 /DNA_START=35 /DNA_END=333 /DNA_ORIENTATION=-
MPQEPSHLMHAPAALLARPSQSAVRSGLSPGWKCAVASDASSGRRQGPSFRSSHPSRMTECEIALAPLFGDPQHMGGCLGRSPHRPSFVASRRLICLTPP